MGCAASSKTYDPVAIKNLQVEIAIIEEELKEMFTFKILLLGAGESGKSTVLKQLNLIHKNEPLESELQQIKNSLHMNVLDCMRSLVNAVTSLHNPDIKPFSEEETELINKIPLQDDSMRLNPEIAGFIETLWRSEPMQSAWARRNEFWILDSWTYYIENISRFASPDWKLTEEDIIMARVRTTGIVQCNLDSRIITEKDDDPDHVTFNMIDVGGQRNERKKWVHCFDNVSAVLFVASLAGYDQVLFEDATKNRMVEALELFSTVRNNEVFNYIPFFVFLNKKDLFEDMLRDRGLDSVYKEYEGPPDDLKKSLEFVKGKYEAIGKEFAEHSVCTVEYISARWKRDVKNAFDDVKNHILHYNLPPLMARRQNLLNKIKSLKQELGAYGADETTNV